MWLCIAAESGCDGREATQEQSSEILVRLRKLRDPAEIRFVAHQEAYREYQKALPGLRHRHPWLDVPDTTSPSELPESFHLRYKGLDDFSFVQAAIDPMPGVSQVAVSATKLNGLKGT
ncbi:MULTISPECIES: permease-like cell division protein FtsX [Actinomadura]|uniref:Permease-like cell division protein FtsX n=1 Tax=Actinomadura yumaensis TaxID=111807 RepID=A0ABW2CGJ2_9ACTN|nr:permease-like cell division protein FtsX [Actinomadura sp. J1-007]